MFESWINAHTNERNMVKTKNIIDVGIKCKNSYTTFNLEHKHA